MLAGYYEEDESGCCVTLHGELIALRGLFLFDKQGVVQHQVVNNMSLGRSVSETLRLVDALQYCEKHGEVCPADWQEGDAAIDARFIF